MVAFLVTLTIVAVVVADYLIRRAAIKKQRETRQLEARPGGLETSGSAFEELPAPDGRFLDPGHTWVQLEASGTTLIGMDDFAQRAIGRIDRVELPEVGRSVRRGEPLFAIRQGGRTAVFTAPIDGLIHSVNEDLARDPQAIKVDAYERGWICNLKPENLARCLKPLLIAEEARAWLNEEAQRFQQFIMAQPIGTMVPGRVLQDGGRLADGVLEFMNEKTWQSFTKKFLHRTDADMQSDAIPGT